MLLLLLLQLLLLLLPLLLLLLPLLLLLLPLLLLPLLLLLGLAALGEARRHRVQAAAVHAEDHDVLGL